MSSYGFLDVKADVLYITKTRLVPDPELRGITKNIKLFSWEAANPYVRQTVTTAGLLTVVAHPFRRFQNRFVKIYQILQ